MFEIEYKGATCLVVATKATKVVSDPKLSLFGLKDVNVTSVVEIATDSRFLLNDDSAKLVIDGPGEYEVGDLSIIGIPATRHIDADTAAPAATIYRIDSDDVRIAILGNVAATLSDDQLESIGVVDIVVLPVGGNGYTLGHTDAVRLVRQLDPKVVMPIHGADVDVAYEVPQDDRGLFVNELGAPVESVGKYKLKNSAMLPSTLTTVMLERT